MRLLIINDAIIDIDDSTAIGITIQNYDIKDINVRRLNVSNTFSIPKTARNLRVIGFASEITSSSKLVYDSLKVDYWIDNIHILKSASIRIESINSRINMFIVQQSSFMDILKSITWQQFQSNYIDFLKSKNYISEYYTNWIAAFDYTLNNNYVKSLGCYTNLYQDDNSIDTVDTLNISYVNNDNTISYGSRFFANTLSIIECIEYITGYTFLDKTELDSIFIDPFFINTFTRLSNIAINDNTLSRVAYFTYIENINLGSIVKKQDKEDKTLADYFVNVLKVFNLIIEESAFNDNGLYLKRFDNITTVDAVDWSKKYIKTENVKFTFGEMAQTNFVKYAKVNEALSEYKCSKELISLNKNLDLKKDIITIDAYIGQVHESNFLPIINTDDGFSNFDFLIADESNTTIFNIRYNGQQISRDLINTSFYDLSGEYILLNSLMKYPLFLEASFQLSFLDIINFKQSKLIYTRQLGGMFFVNKIIGFNPDKSSVPTKVELIKYSNYIPAENGTTSYWVDGVNDYWVDGVNDKFF